VVVWEGVWGGSVGCVPCRWDTVAGVRFVGDLLMFVCVLLFRYMQPDSGYVLRTSARVDRGGRFEFGWRLVTLFDGIGLCVRFVALV